MPISGSSSIGNEDSIAPTTSFLTDVEMFTTDVNVGLRSGFAGKLRLTISMDTAAVLEYTVDSGTTWVTLNNGVALTINSLHIFDCPILSGDLVNFRYKASADVNIFRIDQVLMEG